MNIQEREQWEYEFGCDTERNNLYVLERGALRDDPRIQQELNAGKFIIVVTYTVLSRYDDAIVGSQRDLVSSHDTREEAEQELHKLCETEYEVDLRILPHKPVTVQNPSGGDYDRDEIPF